MEAFSEKIPNALIHEYEEVLTGKHKTFSSYYFRYSDEKNEIEALKVFRYAFDTYLRWAPDQLYYNLTHDILASLKLTQLLKYIIYPPEAEQGVDTYPIIAKLYPGRFRETMPDIVRRVYGRVLSGEREKFPKDFFMGNEGRNKALLCLQYAMNQMTPFTSVQEIYRSFTGTSGSAILRNWKLYAVSSKLFETPLEYLHEALPLAYKSEFWYHYHKFTTKVKKKRIE